MKVGEVGDARRVLASTPMADRDRNTIIDLSALQPDASMAMPREDAFFAMPKGMSPPQLDAEAFLDLLRRSKNDSAPGVSGWTYEMIRRISEDV